MQEIAPTAAVTPEVEEDVPPEETPQTVPEKDAVIEDTSQTVLEEDAVIEDTSQTALTENTLQTAPKEDSISPSEERETAVQLLATAVAEANAVHVEPVLPVPVPPRKRSKLFLAVALFLFLLSISGTTLSAFFAFDYGINAYTTYTTVRNEANDGVTHLLNVKTIFTGLKAHPSGFLDINKLHASQKEFSMAQQDFQHVQYTLSHAAIIGSVIAYLPQYRPEIAAASAMSNIGIDVTAIGQELVHTAITLAPTLRGSLLNSGSTPLVTQPMLDLLGSTIDTIIPNLNDIQAQSRTVSLSALPINAHERDQVAQLLQALPQAETDLLQARDLLGAAGWMLGVDTSRTFLVQTMDRAELRPTGGFTGQYGESVHQRWTCCAILAARYLVDRVCR